MASSPDSDWWEKVANTNDWMGTDAQAADNIRRQEAAQQKSSKPSPRRAAPAKKRPLRDAEVIAWMLKELRAANVTAYRLRRAIDYLDRFSDRVPAASCAMVRACLTIVEVATEVVGSALAEKGRTDVQGLRRIAKLAEQTLAKVKS